jgi:hypothetical protein
MAKGTLPGVYASRWIVKLPTRVNLNQTKPGPHRLEEISNSFQDSRLDGTRLSFTEEMIKTLQTYTGVSYVAIHGLLEYKASPPEFPGFS